jgi:hypothetical protein
MTVDFKEWHAGQVRQCANCYLIEARKLGSGAYFNLRPLRDAVREHIKDLRECVKTFDESAFAENFAGTRNSMQEAANELTEALRADEGMMQKEKVQ